MEELFRRLFLTTFGNELTKIERIAESGSSRKYFRLRSETHACVAVYSTNVVENRAFIDFSQHFVSMGINVPKVYIVSDDNCAYLQQDLGDVCLLDKVNDGRLSNGLLGDEALLLYKKSLSMLLNMQVNGTKGLDYSHCIPRPVFDKRCVMWDLSYFKYCFLKLEGIDMDEDKLENDFERLCVSICSASSDFFMFRDFQSRNIMVLNNDVWFIDFQGGRKGPLLYDVASLLYDAIIDMPDRQRSELLDFYAGEASLMLKQEPQSIKTGFYDFVLVRLLQAMGAFGLRGLYERKQHFLDSIKPGVISLHKLFNLSDIKNRYPELQSVINSLYKNINRE